MPTSLSERELIDLPLRCGPPTQIRGVIRSTPEDFRVEELPAYDADGTEHAHLLLTMTKRGWSSEAALQEIARALGLRRDTLGMAGLKDRHALTTQWISIPAGQETAIAEFNHPDIELGPPKPHRNKLKTGHLRGNKFTLIVREVPRATLDTLTSRVERLKSIGLSNHYGVQRFGHDGQNLGRAQATLRKPLRNRSTRARLMCSVGQSAVFNAYCRLRMGRELENVALVGDVLQKTATGGCFVSEDPATDTERIRSGELCITGPMPGSKYKQGPSDSPAALLEAEAAAAAGYPDIVEIAARHGKRLPGSRRPILVDPRGLTMAEISEVSPGAPTNAALDPQTCSIELRFELPSGSYATNLLREILGHDPESPARDDGSATDRPDSAD